LIGRRTNRLHLHDCAENAGNAIGERLLGLFARAVQVADELADSVGSKLSLARIPILNDNAIQLSYSIWQRNRPLRECLIGYGVHTALSPWSAARRCCGHLVLFCTGKIRIHENGDCGATGNEFARVRAALVGTLYRLALGDSKFQQRVI
jgi:hypothetical protein